MVPRATTLFFLGRSGSGKDTQVEFLLKHPDFVGAVETNTGGFMRELAKEETVLGKKVGQVLESGGLMPGWLSFSGWFSYLRNKVRSDEILISSGSPRRMEEALLEDEASEFLGRPKPVIVHINISPEEAQKRLLLRKRNDDSEASIKNRMAWFETEVLPIVDYYSKEGRVISVDGEGTREEVFARLLLKIEEHFSKKV
ncbi:nucleoside monophosphate kinase [Candidatus Giovannonibacteria bacterium]|nr:nucleoside monophosphate kinase [Candidatus Giovannonibacteria bacterium]